MEEKRQNASAVFGALFAYMLWGVLPVYWKLLEGVPAKEILAHRIVWSFVVMAALVVIMSPGGYFLREIKELVREPKRLLCALGAAALISVNWLTYIWAVNDGRVLETSLGYFITPLASILIGLIFLNERLSFWQKAAVILAAVGVLSQTVNHGRLPWVSIALAATFSFYGLAKKTARLSAIAGMTLETAVCAPFALAYILWLHSEGRGTPFDFSLTTWILMGTGIVTAVPLLIFTRSLNQLSLTTLGLIQYSSPTITFFLGVLLYKEPFNQASLFAFGCIWLGVAVFTAAKTPLLQKWERSLKIRFNAAS